MANHQYVGQKHLSQHLSEFDFWCNTRAMTDGESTIEGIRKAEGKRRMLRRPTKAS